MGAKVISFKHHGNFNKTEVFLKKAKNSDIRRILDSFGRAGVSALIAATPKDSGDTARSWGYEIITYRASIGIVFTNSNVTPNGTPLAILIQYGHGTRNGGYVQGRDFINPAIQPIFDQMADSAWREVTGL